MISTTDSSIKREAEALAAKHQAKAKAAKRQSELSQDVEKRRWQDTQAEKGYIAHLCIYLIPLVMIFRRRDLETEQAKAKQRQQESIAKEQQRMKQHSAIQSIEEIPQFFSSALKEGPNYICTRCHHMMYRKTALEFKTTNYTKAPAECTSAKDKVWVCKACDYALR